MVIHGYTWQYMVIDSNTWQYMAKHGYTWLYMAIQVIDSNILQYMAKHGYNNNDNNNIYHLVLRKLTYIKCSIVHYKLLKLTKKYINYRIKHEYICK